MVILHAARHHPPVPRLARWILTLGILASLAVNVAQGWNHGLVGAVVAAWPRWLRKPGRLDAGVFAAHVVSFRLHLAAENKADKTMPGVFTPSACNLHECAAMVCWTAIWRCWGSMTAPKRHACGVASSTTWCWPVIPPTGSPGTRNLAAGCLPAWRCWTRSPVPEHDLRPVHACIEGPDGGLMPPVLSPICCS